MEWNALKDCGELVLPGDNRFDRVRAKPFIARDAEPVPAAVLRVGCVHGAAGAVTFAREHGLAIAVRTGGHCSVGTSSTTGLLIDTTNLATVTIDGTRATVYANSVSFRGVRRTGR